MKGSGLFEGGGHLQLLAPKTCPGWPKVHSDKYAILHDFCTRPPFFCTFLKTYICLHREGTPTHRYEPIRVDFGLPVAPGAAAGIDMADTTHYPVFPHHRKHT